MNFIIQFLVIAAVTAVSLMIIAKIPPLGVEVDSAGKAFQAGIVFGIFNGIAGVIVQILGHPLFVVLTLGLSLLVLLFVNAIVFSLTAKFVNGFQLRFGIWSAILGAIALSVVNSILFWLLRLFGVVVA